MKRAVLILGLFSTFSLTSFAQNCTVDLSLTSTDISPDTTTNFKKAYVNQSYEQIVQIRMMKDTCANIPPLGNACGYVKYGEVLEINNLPAGFSFVCEPTNCQVEGGKNGCVKISGTPGVGDVNKTFKLEFKLKLSTKINTPFQLDNFDIDTIVKGYKIEVLPEAASVQDHNFLNSVFVQPNPIVATSRIYFTLSTGANVNMVVYNLLGEQVLAKSSYFKGGQNNFVVNKDQFKKGIYFVHLIKGTTKTTKKLIVK